MWFRLPSIRKALRATIVVSLALLAPINARASGGSWTELTSVPLRPLGSDLASAMMWDSVGQRFLLMDPGSLGALDSWEFHPAIGWSRLPLPVFPEDLRAAATWVLPDEARHRFLWGVSAYSQDTVGVIWALELGPPMRWLRLGRMPSRSFYPIPSVSCDRFWCISQRGTSIGLWSTSLQDTADWRIERMVPLPVYTQPRLVDGPRGRLIGFDHSSPSRDSVTVWSTPLVGTEGWTREAPSGPEWPLGTGYPRFLLADTTRGRLVFLNSRSYPYVELWGVDRDALGAWTRLGTQPFTPAVQCAVGDTLWVHGTKDSLGTHGGLTMSASLLQPDSWTIRSNPLRPECRGFEVLLHDASHDRWWGVGENTNAANTVGFDSLWCMRIREDGAEWSRVTTNGTSPPARREAGWAVDQAAHVAYLWGGYRFADQHTFHDLWALDFEDTPHWRAVVADDPAEPGYRGSALVFDPVDRQLLGFGQDLIDVPLSVKGYAVDSLLGWRALAVDDLPDNNPTFPAWRTVITSSAAWDARHDRVTFLDSAPAFLGRIALELRPELKWTGNLVDCETWDWFSGGCPPHVYGTRGFYDPVADRVLEIGGDGYIPMGLYSAASVDTLGPFTRLGGWIPRFSTPSIVCGGDYDASRDALVVQAMGDGTPPFAFYFDREIATGVRRTAADVLDDRFALRWMAVPLAQFELSRRTGAGPWTRMASLVASASGEIGYDDRAIEAGKGYGYRLGALASPDVPVTEDVWLLASTAPSFSLGLAWPNPARDRVSLSFTLPTAAPAMLDVMDIAGRRVWSQRLQGLGPGPHVVSLDRAGIGRAGLYFARLTQAGRSRTTRVVWVP